jgi:hypothetical protein
VPDTGQKGNILTFPGCNRDEKDRKGDQQYREGLALVGELQHGSPMKSVNPMASISGSIQWLKEEMDTNEVNTEAYGNHFKRD